MTRTKHVVAGALALTLVAGCASTKDSHATTAAMRPTPVISAKPQGPIIPPSSPPMANAQASVVEPTEAKVTPPTPAPTRQARVQPSAMPAQTEAAVTTNTSRVTFAEEGSDFDPCISRDGTHLVFASTQHSNSSDIYIKRTDSRVVTQLTNDPGQDAMPVISPDGTKIAFASDRAGNWDIYVMPITGGKAVQITSELSDEIHPSWSPDGKRLVYSRMGEASGRWEMWVAEVQNPSIASFIGYGLFPQWCPVAATGENGADRILFQLGSERGQRAFGIWSVDVTNGTAANATEIASSGNTALINPTWSPDGKWIAYAEVPMSPFATGPQSVGTKPAWATLWMLSIEGEGKVRLTNGPGVSLGPTWGNNNRLYFVCDCTGAENVWSLDLAPAIRAAQVTIGNGNAVAKSTAKEPKSEVANVPENGTSK